MNLENEIRKEGRAPGVEPGRLGGRTQSGPWRAELQGQKCPLGGMEKQGAYQVQEAGSGQAPRLVPEAKEPEGRAGH